MLEIKVKYQWYKQINENYTIKEIPIFAVHGGSKERKEVTTKELKKIVETFLRDKKNGWYPRVHLGHHTSCNDRPGAGFGDNFKLKNNILYSDLAEMPLEIFQEIQNKKKYPYISVEYNPQEDKITSIALLESNEPFFNFPILALDEKESVEKENLFYQKRRNYIIQYRRKNMAFEEKKDPEEKKEGSEGQEKSEGKPPEEKPPEEKYQDDNPGGDPLSQILIMVKQIFEWEKLEHNMQENKLAMGGNPASAGASPDSVAFRKIISSELEKYFKGTGTKKSADLRLKEFCEENNLNYALYSKNMQKYETEEEKEIFLSGVQSTSLAYVKQENPSMPSFANKFARVQNAEDRAKVFYQKMQNSESEKGKKFIKAWSSEESFINYVKRDPSILEGLE